MTSRRTKTLFWLSAIPILFAVGAVAWAVIYSTYLTRSSRDTYFVIFHAQGLRLLAISALLFICTLISLSVDRRKNGRE